MPADQNHHRADEREASNEEHPGGLAGVLRTIFGGGSPPPPVLRRGVDNTVRALKSVAMAISHVRG